MVAGRGIHARRARRDVRMGSRVGGHEVGGILQTQAKGPPRPLRRRGDGIPRNVAHPRRLGTITDESIEAASSRIAQREFGVNVDFIRTFERPYLWRPGEHPYGRPLSLYVSSEPKGGDQGNPVAPILRSRRTPGQSPAGTPPLHRGVCFRTTAVTLDLFAQHQRPRIPRPLFHNYDFHTIV